MTTDDYDDARWSPAGQAIAWALATEIFLAIVAITRPEFHRTSVLIAAAAIIIGSTILAARARMPVQIKGGLIAVACAALLALAAAQDPFGLRAIDRRIDAATTVTTDELAMQIDDRGPVTASVASSQVALQGRGSVAAADFADDLARSVVAKSGGDVEFRIEGLVDVDSGASGDTYRLTWSLARRDDKLWCGRIVATGQARTAVLDSFGTTIAAAMRRSRGGTLACS